VEHARGIVDGALRLGVSIDTIHAMTINVNLGALPQATRRQKRDDLHKIGGLLWKANLAIFFIALFIAASTLFDPSMLTMFMLLVMLITFSVGLLVAGTRYTPFRVQERT
jgi:hypothetical protein